MKRSKWLALNSMLAALAIGVGVVDLSRRAAADRWELIGSDPATGPDEIVARAGGATLADAASANAGTARMPDGVALMEALEPPRSPNPADSPSPLVRAESKSPLAIAADLGWKELVVPPEKPPPAVGEVPEASWLALIGSVTQADGRHFYFFKNERTGVVMRLSPTQPAEGWALELPTAGGYVVEKDGQRYRVRGRQ